MRGHSHGQPHGHYAASLMPGVAGPDNEPAVSCMDWQTGEVNAKCASANRLSPTDAVGTGAGGDTGIDHNKTWPKFPYDPTFWRSHYLHPHP
eukprot:COSAG01_NODE_1275_length_10938_cov_100.784482_14_plen_92_part_00